jgi:hypothetical protein
LVVFPVTMARVKSLKDVEVYITLIKLNLPEDPKHTTKNWRSADLEFVVGHFENFLTGVAQTGLCINTKVLTKCLRQQFASSHQECKEFAHKMQMALAFCRAKSKPGRFTSGKKTATPVLNLMSAISKRAQLHEAAVSDSSSLVDLEEPVLEEPATPPTKKGQGACDDDALAALRKLQEAFGEEHISTTACSSAVLEPPSPMSIASSSCFGSPLVVKMSSGASSSKDHAAELPKVPGFSECALQSLLFSYV